MNRPLRQIVPSLVITLAVALIAGCTDTPTVPTPIVPVAALSTQSIGCVPAPPGLVGWWPGDGSANGLVSEIDLEPFGSPTFNIGLVAQAFSFDGVDDFFSRNSVPLPSANWGMDAWVFWKGPTGEAGKFSHHIFRNGTWDVAQGAGGFDVMVLESDRTLQVAFRSPGGWNSTGVPLSTNVWSHLAVTLEDGLLSVYLNATPVFATTTSAYVPLPQVIPNGLAISAGPNAGAGLTFNGLIDEVDLFNEALSAEAVAAIYAAGSAGKCKPPEALTQLLSLEVLELDLPNGLTNSLLKKLDGAIAKLEDGKIQPAVGKLGEFIDHVEAQRGKKIDGADADGLVADAQAIIDAVMSG